MYVPTAVVLGILELLKRNAMQFKPADKATCRELMKEFIEHEKRLIEDTQLGIQDGHEIIDAIDASQGTP